MRFFSCVAKLLKLKKVLKLQPSWPKHLNLYYCFYLPLKFITDFMNVMEIDFCSSWLLVNKLTIFFFCLTISHFDIARDVSTATASLLQAMGSTGLVQHYVWCKCHLLYFANVTFDILNIIEYILIFIKKKKCTV